MKHLDVLSFDCEPHATVVDVAGTQAILFPFAESMHLHHSLCRPNLVK
jgi:hypothetical protein